MGSMFLSGTQEGGKRSLIKLILTKQNHSLYLLCKYFNAIDQQGSDHYKKFLITMRNVQLLEKKNDEIISWDEDFWCLRYWSWNHTFLIYIQAFYVILRYKFVSMRFS